MTTKSRGKEPFVGPRPFELHHRDIFFGRDKEINDIVSLTISHRVLVLFAQSGAGKTSLLNAGVIPSLINEDFDILPIARVRGMIPNEMSIDEVSNPYALNAIISWADEDESSLIELNKTSISEFLKNRKIKIDEDGFPMPKCIIFDQFEELFTSYPNRWQDREKFILQVTEAIEQDPLLRIIIAIREDYFAHLDPFKKYFPENLRNTFHLECLKKDSGLKAIEGPLEKTTVTITKEAANTILTDLLRVKVETSAGNIEAITGQYVEPVQLQVVCENLWRELPETVTEITTEHFKKFGNVDQALTMFYENAVAETVRSTGVKEGDLRMWFEQRLITPASTRGTVFRGKNKTGGIINEAIDILENQHVIRAERRKGGRWYELTHDRFIKPIQEANEKWLSERKDVEQALKRLESWTNEWIRLGRSEGGLLDEIELLDAKRWIKILKKADISYNDEIMSLISASEKNINKKKLEKEKAYKHELEQVRALAEAEKKSVKAQARMNKFQHRLIISLIIGIVILGLSVLGYFYYYQWEYIEYYNNISSRYGIPVGYGKLSAEQVKHRRFSIKLVKKGRKKKNNHVIRMEAINNKFELTTNHYIGTYFDQGSDDISKACQWEFNCDEDGNIVNETAYDKKRQIIWGLLYEPVNKSNKHERKAYFMSIEYHIPSNDQSQKYGPQKEKTHSSLKPESVYSDDYVKRKTPTFVLSKKAVKISYNNEGYEKEIHYSDLNHDPITGPYNAYGKLQEFDKDGLTTKITSVDKNNMPMIDDAGNSIIELEYDKMGNLIKQTAKDTTGELIKLNNGWTIAKYEYENKYWHLISVRYFDIHNKPAYHKYGYYSDSIYYDDKGNIIGKKFFDINGSPVRLKGYNYAKWNAEYDENGNRIYQAFFDTNDKPVNLKYGNYASWKAKYDDNGNRIYQAHFDKNGKPVNFKYGNYASWKAEYDDNGNQIYEAYFDINGKPTLNDLNYASWKAEYDDNGNRIYKAYFDINDNPILNNYNYAGWKAEYDDNRNQIYGAYFDINGKPTLNKFNYAGWEAEYDDNGNLIYEAFFDTKGKPTLNKLNYASWKAKYDKNGNRIYEAHFDTNGKPVNFKYENYASRKAEYDDNGNQIYEAYFDTNGKPVNYKGKNYASWKAIYDEKGKLITRIFFDVNGKKLYEEKY